MPACVIVRWLYAACIHILYICKTQIAERKRERERERERSLMKKEKEKKITATREEKTWKS